MSRLVTASDYRREIGELEALIQDHEELLDRDGGDFATELSLASLRSRLDELTAEFSALTDAELPGHELDVVLRGQPVERDAIDASFLGRLLGDMQKVVRALVSAEVGHFSRTGPWAAEVERRSTLRFAGSFAGSFGMRLEAVDEQLELEGQLAVQPALESLFSIMDFRGRDPQETLALIAPLGARARSHLRTLLKDLSSAGAEMELTWPLVSGERQAVVSPRRASEMAEVLSRVEETESLERFEGILEGAILRTNFFELTLDSGEIIGGRASSSVLPDVERFFARRCRASVIVTHVIDRGTGEERDIYRLVGLEEPQEESPMEPE